jgi:hypothetical protein
MTVDSRSKCTGYDLAPDFVRRPVVETLAGTMIKLSHNECKGVVREGAEVSAFGKVAAQETVVRAERVAERVSGTFSGGSPKVGAECPNWARSDLCGGRSVMRVPTAIILLFWPAGCVGARADSMMA